MFSPFGLINKKLIDSIEYKRNQRRETKSTIQSQLYSSMTWGCKAVAADLPKLIILILLTVNKSDACTNGKERNIDRYTTVYWSFFAVGVALGVFLLCSAAFVRIVIRDYEADDSDTQPKIIAQATRLKRRFSHKHDESGEVDRGVKRSQPIKNLMLRFASSPAHGIYNADTSSSSDNPDRINVQIVERDVKMDPTIVTDLNLDELSFAHQNKRRASFTETDLSTLPTSPP